MSAGPQVRTRDGWRPLNVGPLPAIRETDTVLLRGLTPSQPVRLGLTELLADSAGEVSLRPATDEHLSGHVGIISLTSAGHALGEIEIIPHKLSQTAYQLLRAELHRVWTDLVFDSGEPTSVQGAPPPARELWRRISHPLMEILGEPSTVLQPGAEVRRLDRVRRLRELTPAVVRAGLHERPALTRALQRSTNTPENALCVATLRLLRSHARRDPNAADIVVSVDRALQHPTLARLDAPFHRVTWGMRSDRRYRQVLAVFQVLNRPELEPTEGPGELRLGVPALSRLYEYWVFLHTLRAARGLYGPPVGPAFEQLATRVKGNRRRLQLPAGTTVRFPGPIHISFEPEIRANGRGWMGLEYVPHPDPDRQQLLATPDVAILDLRADDRPSLTIIDAKYVGRSFVEHEAARVHAKYARMRLGGTSVVDRVFAAHPHRGFSRIWAGYGHFPMVPGDPVDLPLPPPAGHVHSEVESGSADRESHGVSPVSESGSSDFSGA